MQEPQPLGHEFPEEKIDPGRVAARPSEVRDKTYAHRIFGDAEDDWDHRGRGFGRKRSGAAAGCGDNGHLAADQVGHHCRQAIVSALQPVVLDRYVLAFDVASIAEAFAERGHITRRDTIALGGVYECDDRHRRLLRARRERPRCGSTRNQRVELAPVHSITSSASASSLSGIWRPSA